MNPPERALRLGGKYEYAAVPSFAYDTAYTGSDGHIDILSLDNDSYADHSEHTSRSPTRTNSTASRPALSTRLFSSLQNSQPAAAALTRSRSIIHSRAKSLAAWTSGLNDNSSEKSATSPTKNRLFGDLFTGESAPVRLGLPPASPLKESDETEFVMEYTPMFTERPSQHRRRQSLGDRRHSQASSSRSNWFARKLAASTTTLPAAVPEHDDLLTLNINNELFPNGPTDPLSPASFNDLLLNATKLLERMQSAYREKTAYIATIQPEIDAQREEVEVAETRAQHLKMQLEDMARRAQDHNTAMQRLTAQLAEEKLKAQETRDAASSIRVVDEERPEWRRKRTSAGSASDSGFESDPDRDTESVISEAAQTSPLTTPQPSYVEATERRFQSGGHAKLQRQAQWRASNLAPISRNDQGQGVPSSVQQLQTENQELRRQVGEMQTSLQGCIDLLDVLKL